MGQPRVLIVGVSTRALAESAARSGMLAVSVDAFGDLDQKQRAQNLGLERDLGRRYSAALAAAVAARLEAGLAAYVGNLENHPAAVRRLARGRKLLGNGPECLVRARDYRELRAVVEAAGGRFPLTFDSAGDLPAGRSWLRKPRRGGGGSGVARLAAGASLRPDEVAQERIEGTLGSLSFAADGRRAVRLGFSRGLAGDPRLGARGHRYCGSLYPLGLDEAAAARLDAVSQAVTGAFGLRGVNGLDFVLSDGEPVVLELNPRYCASMELLERSHGRSVFGIHADACRGDLPGPAAEAPAVVLGKAILWAKRDLVVGDSRAWLGREDVRDLPFPGDAITRGHPVCTVFAKGRDLEDCHRRLLAAAASLEAEVETGAREARA
jgi:predicted ATP-grasp superfamily ATP-dependent carboligase